MKKIEFLGIALAACLSCGLFELQAQDTVRMTVNCGLEFRWRTVGAEEKLEMRRNGRLDTLDIRKQRYDARWFNQETVEIYTTTPLLSLNIICYRNNDTSSYLNLDVSHLTLDTLRLSVGNFKDVCLDASGCVGMTSLECIGNKLRSLNASGCTSLAYLNLGNMDTVCALDVSGCTALTSLKCSGINLCSLELSGCTALDSLNCSDQRYLRSLNVRGCTALSYLDCSRTWLDSLNVSGCTALTYLDCNDCYYGSCKGGLRLLDVSGCTSLAYLDCSGNNRLDSLHVNSCKALKVLDCSFNSRYLSESELSSLDVSGCSALERLDCSYTRLDSLNVSGCSALERLECRESRLRSLNVSGCPALEYLDCSGNYYLGALDVSGCFALDSLDCGSNSYMKSLDARGCSALTYLDCIPYNLESLKVSGCPALKRMDPKEFSRLYVLEVVGGTADSLVWSETRSMTRLRSLKVSGCTSLSYIDCSDNRLDSLEVIDCAALTYLDCSGNDMTSFDLRDCPALEYLDCNNCYDSYQDGSLRLLDVSGCTSLSYLDCSDNGLDSLDVSDLCAMTYLDCSDNLLDSLDVSGCMALKRLNCSYNRLCSLDVSGCAALTTLYCRGHYNVDASQLRSLDVRGCSVLDSLDCRENKLDSLDLSDCRSLTYLDCGHNGLDSLDLSSFPALKHLNCNYNSLTSLDLSVCPALTYLDCYDNGLSSLDLSVCPALTYLDCGTNWLDSLDMSACPALTYLDCSGSRYSNNSRVLCWLDVSTCQALTYLDCQHNSLRSLDLSACRALTRLDCEGNKLDSLDVSACPALAYLDCSDNDIVVLDVSACPALERLECRECNLNSLDYCNTYSLRADGNRRQGIWDAKPDSFDLSVLPGFDVQRAFDWQGGRVEGHYLICDSSVVYYNYQCCFGDTSRRKVPFSLRVKSGDAELQELYYNESRLGYSYHLLRPGIYDYTLSVRNQCDEIFIGAKGHKGASISGTGWHGLQVGTNNIEVVVTAENGTRKTYTVKIRRDEPDAVLRSLKVSAGVLTPVFSRLVYDYSVEVPYATDSLEVVAEARYNATVLGTGKYGLQVGENKMEIIVTYGREKQIYTLLVKRMPPSSDAALRSLTVSDGYLKPNFLPEVYDYEIENLHHATDSLEVVAEARHSGATVSGAGKYGLYVGENHIEIVVTAEDGTRQTYMLSVIRERLLSSDAALRSLMVSDGYLIPAFSPEVYDYEIENLHHATDSLEVVAEARHDSATVSGTGKYGLHVGENKMEIVVTAEDGTQSVYRLRGYWYGTAVEPKSDLLAVRVYVRDGVIYLSQEIGELAVYTASGLCVYRGEAVVIPVPQMGLYVVRSLADGSSWKVVVR